MNDAYLKFSDGQAITDTKVSTNTLDGDQTRDLGAGMAYIYFRVATTFTSAANTLDVDLVGATATATAGSTKIHNVLRAVAASALVKGYRREISLPRTVMESYSHFALVYTATTALAAGYVNAGIRLTPA